MPNPFSLVELSLLYSVSNAIIAVAMLSVCAAFGYYFWKRSVHAFNLPLLAICVFYFFTACGRFSRAFFFQSVWQVAFDVITGTVGIVAGITIWPLMLQAIRMPTRAELKESNDQLLHAQQMFNSFMAHTPAIQFIQDEAGRFVYANEAFFRTFHLNRADVLGKRPSELHDQSVWNILKSTDASVLQGGGPVETVEEMDVGEAHRYYLVTRFPIHNQVELFGGIAIDITTQQIADEQLADQSTKQRLAEAQLRRTQETMHLLIKSIKDYAIFLLDLKGNVMTWNEGAQKIYGYEAQEIIGSNILNFYPESFRSEEHVRSELKQASETGRYEEENWRLRKDGSLYWASVVITPVYGDDGEHIGFAKVIRDLTERKKIDQELEKARDRALEASALKSAFVANISHEIRTPLSGILGMNELLMQTGLTPEQLDFARTVQESSNALLIVLNDVLDLSKIEAGKMKLDPVPFNLAFVVQDAVRLMSGAALNKGLKMTTNIESGIPDLVVGDPDRIRQILLNLVGNAIKFTPRGEIDIVVNVQEKGPDGRVTVYFSVRDSGIGIAPEESKYLFLPFAQADSSSTRKVGGTGLGLTICKHLIELMGGAIGFDSEKGKGSTFWFNVPFLPAGQHPVTPGTAADKRTAVTGGKVLVVEDNPTMQELARKQLSWLGITCDVVGSGDVALEAVKERQYDAIFMDCHLPIMDGYETTHEIRAFESGLGRRTPIIGMSAAAMSGDKDRALDAGMDDYITKPVTLWGLGATCERWMASPVRRQT